MRIFHGLQFSGTANIPKDGPVIIAANHPSYFDPVVLSLATERGNSVLGAYVAAVVRGPINFRPR